MNAINSMLCVTNSYDTEQARGPCILTKKTLRIPGASLSVFSFQTRGKGELRRNTRGFWWICTDEIGVKCNVTYREIKKCTSTALQVSKQKWNLKQWIRSHFYILYSSQHSDLLYRDYGLLYFPKKVSQQSTDKIKNEIVNISALCLQSTAKVFKKTLANADEK